MYSLAPFCVCAPHQFMCSSAYKYLSMVIWSHSFITTRYLQVIGFHIYIITRSLCVRGRAFSRKVTWLWNSGNSEFWSLRHWWDCLPEAYLPIIEYWPSFKSANYRLRVDVSRRNVPNCLKITNHSHFSVLNPVQVHCPVPRQVIVISPDPRIIGVNVAFTSSKLGYFSWEKGRELGDGGEVRPAPYLAPFVGFK